MLADTGLPHDLGDLALLWLFLVVAITVGVWLAGKLP